MIYVSDYAMSREGIYVIYGSNYKFDNILKDVSKDEKIFLGNEQKKSELIKLFPNLQSQKLVVNKKEVFPRLYIDTDLVHLKFANELAEFSLIGHEAFSINNQFYIYDKTRDIEQIKEKLETILLDYDSNYSVNITSLDDAMRTRGENLNRMFGFTLVSTIVLVFSMIVVSSLSLFMIISFNKKRMILKRLEGDFLPIECIAMSLELLFYKGVVAAVFVKLGEFDIKIIMILLAIDFIASTWVATSLMHRKHGLTKVN